MRRFLLLLLMVPVSGACSPGAQADLPSIGEARSLAAEWALINEQAAQGKLNGTYVGTMRASIRKQLGESASVLTYPQAAYSSEIRALLNEPDDAPPKQLRDHANKLKRIEDSLESA